MSETKDLKTINDINKYLGIYLPYRHHFRKIFDLFIKSEQIRRVKEFKDKGYSRVLMQYLMFDSMFPFFIKSTLNNYSDSMRFESKERKEKTVNQGPKNIENIFQHTISYVTQRLLDKEPFEHIKFIVLPQELDVSNVLVNMQYLHMNGCKEELKDNFSYFSNKCTQITNNMNPSGSRSKSNNYAKLDSEYYKKYDDKRDAKGHLKRLTAFKKENPSIYYNKLYSSFNINDLKIGIISESKKTDVIIDLVFVIGVGYQMYYDTLKVILLSLDDDCNTCHSKMVDLDELFILGHHHPLVNFTDVTDATKADIVNITLRPNKPKFIQCRNRKYSTRKQELARLRACRKIKAGF